MESKVVTRMAPSPTGLFHIGSVRTALYNYLFTEQNKGKFILRIEDTDKERSKKEFEDNIIESLKWLGIAYDDFYRQSERTDIYKNYLQKLIDNKFAYWSSPEDEELGASLSKRQIDKEKNRSSVIRFSNVGKKIKFNDLVLREIEFDTTELGDFVIAKDLETPLYHFAVVVDDIEMGITHIIRGQDHVSNTARQILILEALGGERPQYAHIPLILSPDKQKLSKRHGALPVLEYKELGYLPEAVLNFLALIGWNPGTEKEIFTLGDLIKEFSLERVQKSGGVFNIEKLNWINKEHIKKLSSENFWKNAKPFLPNIEIDDLQDKEQIIRERIEKFSDLEKFFIKGGELYFFFHKPEYEKSKLVYKNTSPEKIKNNLELAIKALTDLDENNFTQENIKTTLMNIADKLESRGELLHPVRYALSGLDKSPDPFTISAVIGKNETLSRLQKAI